jgi:hypothetical protein
MATFGILSEAIYKDYADLAIVGKQSKKMEDSEV